MKKNYFINLRFSKTWRAAMIFAIAFSAAGCVKGSESKIYDNATPVRAEAVDAEELSASGGQWNPPGIFQEHNKRAYEKLNSLSMQEKIGQMLLVRCPQEKAAQLIKEYKPGGFVLFKRDFEGKTFSQVAEMTEAFQKEADIPMIISVDEEGGTVVRFSSNPLIKDEPFKSPQEIFKDGGMAAIIEDAERKAQLMKELGLNNNLAPVVDLCENPTDYMYKRTFGADPSETGEYADAVVRAMQGKGIACTLKHFPGYGSNLDTHTGTSRDERAREEFFHKDFVPFKMGITSGVHSILVSHNTVDCFDPSLPMSISPATSKLLRDELGFTGVIMTDDLEMDAAILPEDSVEPEILAVLAGNDMLIVTDYAEAFEAIYGAVIRGEISTEIIDGAVFKILGWKYELGLLY